MRTKMCKNAANVDVPMRLAGCGVNPACPNTVVTLTCIQPDTPDQAHLKEN